MLTWKGFSVGYSKVDVVFFPWARRTESTLPDNVAEARTALRANSRLHATASSRKHVRWSSLRVSQERAGPRENTPFLPHYNQAPYFHARYHRNLVGKRVLKASCLFSLGGSEPV